MIDCTAGAHVERGELATPILMRVIGGAFSAIAKEMSSVLFRMSYSSIIRESEDLGAGIFDAEGNELAESDSTPMFMGAMPKIVKGVIQLLGDEIHDGDVILHNDPYLGATHSPDVAIVVPIFHEGELVGFSGASAHLLDIGGAFPGLAVDLVDNWSEGNIYRAVKLSERGVRQDALWKHILENTRTPTYNRGDVEAMIAACELAKTRYLELLRRYGKDAVLGAARDWIDYSERMLRQEIAKVPDGVYETDVGWLDDDGRNRGVPLPVKVKVVIEGDELTIDLTGSSDEVPTGYNCPYEGTTVSAMTFIVRMIFLDEAAYPVFVPQNEGMLKPVKVIAPKGSIFNPNYPRACFARFCQVQRAVDLVLQGAGAGRAGADHRRQLGAPALHLVLRLQRRVAGVLGLPRGGRGLVRGAAGARRARLRRLPDREHAQQPDRGARVALPDADGALRAARRAGGGRQVARRDRDGARQPLPRRHDRHLRGRAARLGSAVGDLRRPRRDERVDDPQRRDRATRSAGRRR